MFHRKKLTLYKPRIFGFTSQYIHVRVKYTHKLAYVCTNIHKSLQLLVLDAPITQNTPVEGRCDWHFEFYVHIRKCSCELQLVGREPHVSQTRSEC